MVFTGRKYKTVLSLVCALALFGLWFWLQRQWLQEFDLQSFQRSVAASAQWAAARPWLAALSFVSVYVLVASLSIPLAPLLSLAGGALFGWELGVVLVLGARALGATLAAALVRMLLRERLRLRHAVAMQRFDAGIARDGLWYLLSLRLFPAFPYVLVNVLGGLSAMPLHPFFWVSLLGMLPAATLQVLAGVQLAQLHSLTELQPPWALLAMGLLAVLPLLVRRLLQRLSVAS